MTIYSLDVLLSRFGTNLLFHVQFKLLLPRGIHSYTVESVKRQSRGRRKVGRPGPVLSPCPAVFSGQQWGWGGRTARAHFFPQHLTLLSTGPRPGAGWKHPPAPCSAPRERQHRSNTSHVLGSQFPIMNVTFSNFADIFKSSLFHQSIITSKFLTVSKEIS